MASLHSTKYSLQSVSEKTLWVSDKCVQLYGISLYSGDIALTIHWYEHINGISGADLV